MPWKRCLFAIVLIGPTLLGGERAENSGNVALPQRIPDVMYIPTPPDVVEAMLQLAEVGKNDVVYDPGCGDGRILITAARRFGCRAVGCDIDPLRVESARENVREARLEHLIRVEQQDLFDMDLRGATVVTLYLSPAYNRRLIPMLRMMPPGSRIVSHQFAIHGLTPDKIVRVKSGQDPHVHVLYRFRSPFRR